MKTLVYKGFGMENLVSIFFNISVGKWEINPISVEVKTDDQEFLVTDQDYQDMDVRCTSEVYFAGTNERFCAQTAQDVKYSHWDEEEWQRDTEMYFYVDYKNFKSISDAVSWIKEIVNERRGYWKTRKGEYNRLVAELRELTIEDFLDESAGDEITISQTVRRRK